MTQGNKDQGNLTDLKHAIEIKRDLALTESKKKDPWTNPSGDLASFCIANGKYEMADEILSLIDVVCRKNKKQTSRKVINLGKSEYSSVSPKNWEKMLQGKDPGEG